MCDFEDEIKPPSANLQSGLFNIHSFKAYLLTEFVNSKTEREPQGGILLRLISTPTFGITINYSASQPPRRCS